MKRKSLPLAASILTVASTLSTVLPGHAQPLSVRHSGTYTSAKITEIVAYDPASKLMYTAAGTDGGINVIDVSNPAAPTLSTVQGGTISITAILAGYTDVNSVSIKNGVLAAAVANSDGTQPGRVFFFNAATGEHLGNVASGVLPDMLTFTPDGKKVLVANEGEMVAGGTRGGAGDPEGSITVIRFANDAPVSPANAAGATAQQLTFTAFNGQEEDLRRRGVRIFPTVSAAQDLEPEYIAVSPDGKEARVTLQEASAFAVIKNLDTASPTLSEIQPLQAKDFSKGLPSVENFTWDPNVTIGATATGQSLKLGGFSGLHFEGYNGSKLRMITITDRGPNGEPADYVPSTPGQERPFALPAFQPRMVRFELDPATGRVTLLNQILLFKPDGVTPMTGLPNMTGGTPNLAYVDETPIDLSKNLIPTDPLGIDPEGIVTQAGPDGVIGTIDDIFWAVDEYRVAILKFQAQPGGGAKLIKRYVPAGTAAANGGAPLSTADSEALPAVYAQRRPNRGFEAVALDATLGKVYAFIQSPLDNPDTTANSTSSSSRNLRIVELDIATEAVTGEYLYVLDNVSGAGTSKADKIADAVSLGKGRFLAIERDDRTDGLSSKLAYEVDLKGATNINVTANLAGLSGAQTVENLTVDQLAALTPPIYPTWKRSIANLASVGYTGVSKLEGFTFINETTWAVINDNDFAMSGVIAGNGSAPLNPSPEPIQIGLVTFDQSNGLDASDREISSSLGAIQIVNRPVLGLPMPDSIASFSAGGQAYYITANEGDDRGEVERLSNAIFPLDPGAFPNAATLKGNAVLGRLNVSSIEGKLNLGGASVTTTRIDGDYDLDGDFDALYTIGTRSFTIWNAQGRRVYDSGDDFERITAELVPAQFNSDGTAASYDTRSDNKGPEPEAAATGVINGRTYAFIGLERTGGIMVYDVTNPVEAEFVQYVSQVGDVAPEGLIFLPADASPFNGVPGLAVANEVSKTLSLYRIDLQPRVVAVAAASAAGRYAAGDEILIAVNFDQTVTVTGSPTLTLNVGGVARTATYVGAEGNKLTFRYIVQAGDNVADLDYVGADSLDLAGGTIQGATSNLAAATVLPAPGADGSLGKNSAIVIDTVQGLILLTGTYAQGADGAPGSNTNNLPLGYLYNKFHGVVTSGSSRLAYSAEVAPAFGKGKPLTGIWSDNLGSPRLLARQDMPNPAVTPNLFAAFTPAAFATDLFSSEAGQAVFRGNVTKQGFSFWRQAAGGLDILAKANDQVASASLKSVNPGAVDASGKAYFTATFAAKNGTNANNDSALVKAGVAGDDLVLAREGQDAPGASGALYGQLAGRVSVSPGGSVAFVAPLTKGTDSGFNATNDTALFVGTTPAKLVRENDPADGATSGVFAGFGRPALNTAGKVALAAVVRAVPGTKLVNATNDSGIWSDLAGTVKLVAREGAQAPDTAGTPIPGVTFKEMRGASPLITDQFVIFSASLAGNTVKPNNDVALFSWNGTTLRMIAREGDVAKGARDGALIDKITTFAANPAGHVAFGSRLTSAAASQAISRFNDSAILRTDAAAVNPTIIFRTGDTVSPAPGMPALLNIRALNFLPGSAGADGWGRAVDDLGGVATVLTFQGGVQGIGTLDGVDQ